MIMTNEEARLLNEMGLMPDKAYYQQYDTKPVYERLAELSYGYVP